MGQVRSWLVALIDVRSASVFQVIVWMAALVSVGVYIGKGIESLSPFAFAFGKLALIAFAFDLFDRVLFRKIKTVEGIQNGNVAVGLWLVAVAIILHAVFGNV